MADPDVFRFVCLERLTFIKDPESLEALNIYGPNLSGTEGAGWKRERDKRDLN